MGPRELVTMNIGIISLVLLAAAQWTRIGPGGGGAQFIPTISPHDPSTILVRCDMTGAYLTRDGGKSWGMVNIGGVRAFVYDPKDKCTMYALGLGLWRSTDSGVTWTMLYPDPSDVAAIEMPDDHASGRIVTKDGRYPRITAMAINPKNSKHLYVAGSGSLMESSDAGKTWKKTSELPQNVIKLFINDQKATFIASKSTIIGTKEYANPAQFIDISAGGNRFYAISRESVHISDDGGRTWRDSALPSTSKPRLNAIATSGNHSDIAYVSYSNLDGKYLGVAECTRRKRS